MARVEETERYFRIPADDRDLNYQMYFTQGEREVSELADYTSHNTTRLDVPQIKELLLSLDYIRDKMRGKDSALD
jgi:UDP-glucose 4-epimerase